MKKINLVVGVKDTTKTNMMKDLLENIKLKKKKMSEEKIQKE